MIDTVVAGLVALYLMHGAWRRRAAARSTC